MRLHPVNCLIALVVSGLITYGLLSLDSNLFKLIIGVGSYLFCAITLIFAIGVIFENARVGVNVRIISWVFFLIGLVQHLLFSFINLSQTSYVISTGVIFMLYVLVANSVFNAKQ